MNTPYFFGTKNHVKCDIVFSAKQALLLSKMLSAKIILYEIITINERFFKRKSQQNFFLGGKVTRLVF